MSRRLHRSVIALGAALMLVSGRLPAAGPSTASDATITAAVQLVLWKEGSLAGTDIRIETADGDVTLRGFANTMEDIAIAGRLARAVPGVRAVRNAIQVPVQPSRV